jgi:hypothetical protein
MKAFALTKEQMEIYSWLKTKGLNTDDDTLNYWVRTYKADRLKEVVNFALKRISEGQEIRNIGGWVHKLLKTGLAVVNDNCKENRDWAQNFAKENQWTELTIYEKYLRDKITDSDLPLTMEKDEFARALASLYDRSKLYKHL